jgi:hypothetical protein
MKRLIEATEHPLKDGLEAAQGALGSGADVARLREKLGGLPLPPPTPDGTSTNTSANTDTSLATTKLLHRVATSMYRTASCASRSAEMFCAAAPMSTAASSREQALVQRPKASRIGVMAWIAA